MPVKKPVKSAAPIRKRAPEEDDREPRESERGHDRDSDRGGERGGDRGYSRSDRDSRSSGREEQSEFVNITKLFETKKNPDNLVGTCKPEYLDKLADLVAEAIDKNKGVSFFVFTAGKWGASLAATLSKDHGGSFSDGDRGRSRGRSRY